MPTLRQRHVLGFWLGSRAEWNVLMHQLKDEVCTRPRQRCRCLDLSRLSQSCAHRVALPPVRAFLPPAGAVAGAVVQDAVAQLQPLGSVAERAAAAARQVCAGLQLRRPHGAGGKSAKRGASQSRTRSWWPPRERGLPCPRALPSPRRRTPRPSSLSWPSAAAAPASRACWTCACAPPRTSWTCGAARRTSSEARHAPRPKAAAPAPQRRPPPPAPSPPQRCTPRGRPAAWLTPTATPPTRSHSEQERHWPLTKSSSCLVGQAPAPLRRHRSCCTLTVGRSSPLRRLPRRRRLSRSWMRARAGQGSRRRRWWCWRVTGAGPEAPWCWWGAAEVRGRRQDPARCSWPLWGRLRR